MERICRSCKNRSICTNQSPLGIGGSIPRRYLDCLRYTCPDGTQAARQALNRQTVPFETANGLVDGHPFGTQHKPTTFGRVRRFFDSDGKIYIQDGDQQAEETGQRLRWMKFIKR